MHRTQAQQGEGLTPGQSFNILYFFLTGYAACFWPFLRTGFGVRAFHTAGIGAMIVMYLAAAFGPCPEMIYFFPVWLALVVIHRLDAFRNDARGRQRHSLYDGYPWLVMGCLRVKPDHEYLAKGLFEPVILFIAGALLLYGPEMKSALFLIPRFVLSEEDFRLRLARDIR
jgi:hypothetical protein